MIKSVLLMVAAGLQLAAAVDYADLWLSVRKQPVAYPTFCPSWNYPNTAAFYNVSVGGGNYVNLNGTASMVPWLSDTAAAALSQTVAPLTHFYFKVGVCEFAYLPTDPVISALFTTLGSYYRLTYNSGAGTYDFLYQCGPGCTTCLLNTTYTMGSCSSAQIRNSTVPPLTFEVLLSLPRPPINETTLRNGLSAAGMYGLVAGSAVTPITAVYSLTNMCDSSASYYRLGFAMSISATMGSFGADCYSPSGLGVPDYVAPICTQAPSAGAVRLFVRKYNAAVGAGYDSCQLPGSAHDIGVAAAFSTNLTTLNGTDVPNQPSSNVYASPATRAGTNAGIRECTASGCTGSYLLSSITVCSGALTTAADLVRTAQATVTCPTMPPATAAPTETPTPAPSSASSLVGSVAVFLTLLCASLAL